MINLKENASEHPGDSACFFLRLVRSTRVPPRGRQLGSHLILSSTGTISSTRLSLFLFFSLAKLAPPLSPGASLRRHGHAPPLSRLERCSVSHARPPRGCPTSLKTPGASPLSPIQGSPKTLPSKVARSGAVSVGAALLRAPGRRCCHWHSASRPGCQCYKREEAVLPMAATSATNGGRGRYNGWPSVLQSSRRGRCYRRPSALLQSPIAAATITQRRCCEAAAASHRRCCNRPPALLRGRRRWPPALQREAAVPGHPPPLLQTAVGVATIGHQHCYKRPCLCIFLVAVAVLPWRRRCCERSASRGGR
jgi:hypothetical protein